MDNTVRLRFKNPTYINPIRWRENKNYRTAVKTEWYKGLDNAQQNLLQSVCRWDFVVVDRERARSEVYLEIEVAKPKQATMAQLLFY